MTLSLGAMVGRLLLSVGVCIGVVPCCRPSEALCMMCSSSRRAVNGGAENAGVEKAGAITDGKP